MQNNWCASHQREIIRRCSYPQCANPQQSQCRDCELCPEWHYAYKHIQEPNLELYKEDMGQIINIQNDQFEEILNYQQSDKTQVIPQIIIHIPKGQAEKDKQYLEVCKSSHDVVNKNVQPTMQNLFDELIEEQERDDFEQLYAREEDPDPPPCYLKEQELNQSSFEESNFQDNQPNQDQPNNEQMQSQDYIKKKTYSQQAGVE